MRRDVCYYFPTDVVSLFDAYAKAAVNPPFERECKFEAYHTINFGLNFSMKYNMNGGACILHFMPLPDGAAVDMRFVIAQAFGARYEAYAEDLTRQVAAILDLQPTPAQIDVELFLKEENKVTAAPVTVTAPAPAPVAPVVAPAPVEVPVEAPVVAPAPVEVPVEAPVQTPVEAPVVMPAPAFAPKFCTHCGRPIEADARFCSGCGTPTAQPAGRVCPVCRTTAANGAAFCTKCGTRL